MQTTRAANVLVFALLALGASAARRSSSSAGLSQAREWLRSHGPAPPQDELQELKGANPEAYAIVKALLTKRALGLLDPRHPTASFAPGQAADAAPRMSSVDFAASVRVKASSGAAPETADDTAEVAPPPVHHSHKDWLNWRPADSAAEDDAQVQQVLGAASQLRAGGVASAAPAAGDAPAPPEPAPPAKQQGLVGVRQAVSQDFAGGDYLKDFSWSDGDAAAFRPDVDAHPLPPARIVPQDGALPAARILAPLGGQQEAAADAAGPTTPAPPRKQNALVSWLGSSWGPAQAPPAATKQTATSSSGTSARRGAGRYSRYLEDLAGSS